MIKTRTLILAALAAASIAGPTLAQPYGPPPGPGPGDWHDHHDDRGPMQGGGWDLDRRIGWIQDKINRGRGDGSLDRHEFRRVQGQLNFIRHREHQLMWRDHGQTDGPDFDQLRGQLDHLNDEIHWLRTNGDQRPW